MIKFSLTFLSYLLIQVAFGQDVIVIVSGEELLAKVLEISIKEIVYQSPDSVNGKLYRLPKSDVFMIRYANGSKDVFQENITALQDTTMVAVDPEQLYLLGMQDGRHYKKERDLFKRSTKEPAVPVLAYKQDPNYINGFEEGTRKRENKKVRVGLGLIGACVAFMVYIGNALGGGNL